MNAWTLPRYLLGSRRAIMQIASSRWSPLIGIIFVLSAGFAREYDGEDLIHEPWHALRPLGASLVSGTVLFIIIHVSALLRENENSGVRPRFTEAWTRFMGLFWLTAPMAWLYAVPYERFMSPVDAIAVNLWTLAIVAGWRVILMTRVIRVVYGFGPLASFFLVMLFADAVVFAAILIAPTPVIDVMGGIRHSDRDALISGITFMVGTLSVLTAPLWIIGALIAARIVKPRWPDFSKVQDQPRSRGLLVFAIGSVAAFIPLLLITQPEQIKKRHAERLLTRGDVPAALAEMSRRTPGDYPPHWNPPPRLGYRESVPDLDAVRDAMWAEWPAEWVAEIYLVKIAQGLRQNLLPYIHDASWTQVADHVAEYRDYADIEPGHGITARFLLDHTPSLSEHDRDALERIERIAAEDRE